MDCSKAARSVVAAGCPPDVAQEIADAIRNHHSTETIREHITAELLRRGHAEAAGRYQSYRAGFSPAAIRVLQSRYLVRGNDGEPAETPREMFGRVAVCMALPYLAGADPPEAAAGFRLSPHHIISYTTLRAREWPEGSGDPPGMFGEMVSKYHDIMVSRRFLPNSPTLMNAGAALGQLSACFVLDVPDTLSGIMDTVKHTALIFQSGGGVGINYSDLRPAGSRVGSTAGVASGPISFMGLVDSVSEVVKQGGRRRAANMGVLEAWHPDIINFIRSKRGRSLANFNISVGTDAEFWEALRTDGEYHGMWPARILDEIAESAHQSAEPGIIFFDNINKHNMLERARGRPLRSTNPCWGGETEVLTRDGPVTFRELANGPSKVKVLTREDDGSLSYRIMQNPGLTQSGADTICLVVQSKSTGECSALRCTPDHNIYVVAGSRVEKRAAKDLTPGMSLASVYLDGAVYEQTIGVSVPAAEVREQSMKGTGHPSPGMLPLSLAKSTTKSQKRKASVEGFITPEGDVPDSAEKKPGFLGRLFGKKNHAVLAVIQTGKADVYNGMVETTHCYFVRAGPDHYVLSGNCGEQALYPNESCNLGSINISEYVSEGAIRWDALERDARLCTRMLDGVVDTTRHPTPDIERASNETRRVGLGVMGVADALMYAGIPYNSEAAYKLFGRLAEFISYHSMSESVRMAAERGPFPIYGKSAYVDGRLPFAGNTTPCHPWEHHSNMAWDDLLREIERYGIRNVLTTTIAPTGTISMIAGCSSGIEPVFSLAYTKTVSVGSFCYGCPALEAAHPDIVEAVAAAGGVMPPGLVDDEAVYVTARRIHWADHVLAQAAWQRWIGNSISKTINMAASASVRDVRDTYVLAHSLGCRGLTIYRDGSRDTQVLEGVDAGGDPEPSPAAAGLV